MRLRSVILTLVMLAACSNAGGGTEVGEAPEIPETAVGGPSTIAIVDRQVLLDDAVDPEAVDLALMDAGFRIGAERVARDRQADVRETRVRVLRFADSAGAAAWLAYVDEHPVDVVGTATRGAPTGRAVVYHHVPDGCCPGKDLPSWWALSAGGTLVTVVVVRGPAVTRADLVSAMATAGLPEE